jgi:uncharacterized membrane protein YkvA (DUF1232 family)
LRPRRNRKTPPAPPADTVPLASAKHIDRANRASRAKRDDANAAPLNATTSSATTSSATTSNESSETADLSVWQALRQRAERDIETVSTFTTRFADRAETVNPSDDRPVKPDMSPESSNPEPSETVDPPVWVDRLRPKQLENQLNQQFRQFQARQQSQAESGMEPETDDRASLATQFDRILNNLPQRLRIDRTDIERRFETFARNAKPEDVGKIIKRLPEMNRGAMREIWPKVRSLLEMIRDPSAAWTAKALAIGALVYLISPLDAIPDFIPFAGLVDDAALIVAVVATLARQLDQYMRQSMQASVETAERLAEIEVQKYNRIVRITLLGSIATALITIGLKLWLDHN